LANEHIIQVTTSASPFRRTSHSSTVVAWGSDDDFEFPRTERPRDKLLAASLFVLSSATFVVWGGWRLISSILEFIGVRGRRYRSRA
jgi:hypothetical protein